MEGLERRQAIGSSSHLADLGDRLMPASRAEANRPVVLIVDDDEEVRTSLQELMLSVDIETSCFASSREFLEAKLPERPGCLLLDVRMPGTSGLDVQQQLALRGNAKPIIFLTGYGDIPMTVQAMKAGAVDFLTKPFREQTVLDAVVMAIELDVGTASGNPDHQAQYYAVCDTHTARAASNAGGCAWSTEQTDRPRPRHYRGDRQAPPRQCHAQDAGGLNRRAHTGVESLPGEVRDKELA